MKKIYILPSALLFILPSIASAALIPTTVYRDTTSSFIRPLISGDGLRIPSFGGFGTLCIQTDNDGDLSVASAACGSGSGGGSGTWATTTSTVSGNLINYPLNTTDIVTVGGNATTTAKVFLDPNSLVNYFLGKIGIASTSPTQKLSVQGNALISGDLRLANITATGTIIGSKGSESAPAIIPWEDDANTGIFSSGQNNIVFSTNGSTQLTISAASDIEARSDVLSDTSRAFYLRRVAGSAGAPTFTFNSDSDTGLWSPFANTFSLSAGGLEVLRSDIASTSLLLGNFGVGTSTPNEKLSIQGNGEFMGTLNVANSIRTGNLTATGTLTVAGASSFTGTGTTTFAGGVSAVGLASSAGLTVTAGSLLSTSLATSTWSGGHALTSLSVSQGLLVSGGSILNTSTATSTFSGGISTVGLSSTAGLLISAGSILNTSLASSTFSGGIKVNGTGGFSTGSGLTITGGSLKSSGNLEITSSATSSFTGGITSAGLSSSAGVTVTNGYLTVGTGVVPAFNTLVVNVASTSPIVSNATTTVFAGPAAGNLTVDGVRCETDTGTVGVSLFDGTNRADYIPTASTTINYFTYTSNNTFTKGESMRVDVGTGASSAAQVTCRFLYRYTSI